MSLVKSRGNMYDWVTHMHTHLGGECGHRCQYCYVGRGRFGRAEKYSGPIRLIEKELTVNYGTGKTIFIEHMNDLFERSVPPLWIDQVLAHCCRYPKNEYVFQTKNPERAWSYYLQKRFPPKLMIGTTIETNRPTENISNAPSTQSRGLSIGYFHLHGVKTFITVEPIVAFDPLILASWIAAAHPSFVNIGADSKRCGIPDPSPQDVLELINFLAEEGITIRKKHNLERLLNPKDPRP